MPKYLDEPGLAHFWNNAKNTIDTEIKKSQTERKGMWGISRINNTSNEHYLLYSDDGLHFEFKKKLESNVASDSSAVYSIGDWFYYIGSRTWQKSQDLVTWTDATTFPLTLPISNGRVWGTSLLTGYNDTIYVLHSVQYNDETVPLTGVGSTSYYFRIDAYEIEQMENGDLRVIDPSSPTTLFGGSNSESFIDPYAIYDSDYGIVIAVKDEVASTVAVYKGNTLDTLEKVSITNNLIGIEGPQLIIDDSKNIYLYVHGPSSRTVSAHESVESSRLPINNLINAIWRCQIASGYHQATDTSSFVFASMMLWELVTFPTTVRHPGLSLCTADVYKAISKYNSLPFENWTSHDTLYKAFPTTQEASSDAKAVLTNSPREITTAYGVRGAPASITIEYRRIFRHRGIAYLYGATSQSNIGNAVLKLGNGIDAYSASQQRKLRLDGLYDNGVYPMWCSNTLTVPYTNI